ncbi:MAG: MMPL family transporter [Polyangiaceae bacterium]|nr:MMPL family transporter [Polyangiaceae bacterium]
MAVITTDGLFEESSKLIDWSDQVAEMRAELANRQLRAAFRVENAIAGRIFRTIPESGARILAAAFAVVFIVLVIQFHSLWHALAVLSSVAIGLLFTAGGMAVFDIELNFMNAAVLPIIVGVSVDNAIHIYHRFLESGPASIPMVLRQTGSAALLSSSANLRASRRSFVARNGGQVRRLAERARHPSPQSSTTTVIFPVALDWIGQRLGRVPSSREPTPR